MRSIHCASILSCCGLLLGVVTLGCRADDDIGSPLSIELAGPGTAQAGEELSVHYEVSGRQLVGIIFDWGDGATDSVPARGAQTASGSVHHTYVEAGTVTVTGRAEDIVEGFAEARVEIEVQP